MGGNTRDFNPTRKPMTDEPRTLPGTARVIAASVALLGGLAIISGLVLLGVMLIRTLREGADPPTMIYFGVSAAVFGLIQLDERTVTALWPALPDLGGLGVGVVLYLVLQWRLIPAGLPQR
jgi:hypothetical protein